MDFSDFLLRQRRGGLADFAGAEATATIPVSQNLINELLAANIPSSAPVRDVQITPHAGNEFAVRLRLSKPAFLPAFSLRLHIEQQPDLPGSPVLVLRLSAPRALMVMAGSALGFLRALPPGVTLDGDRIALNLKTILEARGYGEVLRYLGSLRVTTDDGKVVLEVRGRIPPATGSGGKRGEPVADRGDFPGREPVTG